jgi:hypothetical protein
MLCMHAHHAHLPRRSHSVNLRHICKVCMHMALAAAGGQLATAARIVIQRNRRPSAVLKLMRRLRAEGSVRSCHECSLMTLVSKLMRKCAFIPLMRKRHMGSILMSRSFLTSGSFPCADPPARSVDTMGGMSRTGA